MENYRSENVTQVKIAGNFLKNRIDCRNMKPFKQRTTKKPDRSYPPGFKINQKRLESVPSTPSREGELGNAGFIEIPFAKLDHSIVLILGRLCKREVESSGLSECESNPGVF